MSSFCKCKSYLHFFSKNISKYAIFNDQSFNDTLTNDIVSFEQLGPDLLENREPLMPELGVYVALQTTLLPYEESQFFMFKVFPRTTIIEFIPHYRESTLQLLGFWHFANTLAVILRCACDIDV